MSKLRDAARGQDCLVRVPGCCNHNPETVVLAHYRLAGICGAGFKPLDLAGAWCGSACHDVLDGRAPSAWNKDELRLFHAEGVMRTLDALAKRKLVK